MRLGIRSKITFIAFAILFFALGANTLISTSIFQKEYSSVLQHNAFIVGRNLKIQLDKLMGLGISLDNLIGFDEQCQDVVAKNKDLSYAMVVKLDGMILFHNDPDYRHKKLTDPVMLKAIKSVNESANISLVGESENYLMSIPISSPFDEHVAAVILGFPADLITHKTRGLIMSSVVMAIIFFILAIILLVFSLSLWVTGPLKKLVGVIEEIRKNRILSRKVEIASGDEIGQLAFAFNNMTEDLQKTTTSIANLNKEIAEREKVEAALRESEGRFKQVAENAGEWIWETDSQGLYTYANPIVADIIGYRPEEVVGKMHFYDLFAPEVREELKKAAFEIVARKGSFKGFVNPNIHKNGKKIILETSGAPILDENGNPLGYRGTDTDITERKQAEEALKEYAHKVEEANKKKTEFVSDVSHELRTPLASIKGFTSTVRAERDMDPDTRNEFLMIVEDEADRLTRIIEGLLDLSRVESGRIKLKKQNVRLTDLIKRDVEIVRKLAEEKQLKLSAQLPEQFPLVFADSDKMSQIIINLLSNAIKYTKEGGVSISARKEDGHVLVEVSDTGIGIAEKDMPKVFDKFQRFETPGIEARGTGLGLSIVKAMVEVHGGEVFFESEVGKGSKFGFRLPALIQGEDRK
jgi:PAS domain S-box-containing protein